ncbi:hypothetical protein Tco_1354139 [Tanacetum coccineum]
MSVNRHSPVKAAVSLAAILLISMPLVGLMKLVAIASLVNSDAVNNLLWASLSWLLQTPSQESLTSSLGPFDAVTRNYDAISMHNSVNTKFAKSSILGKPALQPRRNQSVVRQPTAFKSERPRISKQRFTSQVDVNNDLSKPVTPHYFLRKEKSAVAKPHHMIAPGFI